MWASWRQELPRGYFSVLLQDLALLRAPLLLLETSPPPNSSFSISLIPPGTGAWPPSLLYPHILLGALKPTHKVHLLLCLEAQMTKLRFSNLWQSTQTQYLKKINLIVFFLHPNHHLFFPLQTSISSSISYLTQVYDHSHTQAGNWEPSVTGLSLILLLASDF